MTPRVLLMCSLALLRRPLSIHETCVQTHVEENLSDPKSEYVFCSSQILVKRFFLIRSRNQSGICQFTMPTVVHRKWREIKQCSANNSPQLFGGAMHNTKNNNDALDRIHTVGNTRSLGCVFLKHNSKTLDILVVFLTEGLIQLTFFKKKTFFGALFGNHNRFKGPAGVTYRTLRFADVQET